MPGGRVAFGWRHYWLIATIFPSAALAAGEPWTVMSSPNPGAYDDVNGVSCYAVDSCMAVGVYNPSDTTPQQALTETLTGPSSSWAVLGNPTGADTELEAVSCVSSTWCVAVGEDGDGSLILSWTGTAWSMMTAPVVGAQSVLSGVS